MLKCHGMKQQLSPPSNLQTDILCTGESCLPEWQEETMQAQQDDSGC